MAMKSRSPEEIDREIERLTRQRDGGIVDFPRVVGREKRPVGCTENTLALLKHYDVTARYNEMTKKQEIHILGQSLHKDTADNDSISVIRDMARLQQYDPNAAEENVNVICSENAYHPARNWILERPWDQQDRIGELLATLDTVEEEDFVRMLLTKWMIGTVSLVMYDTEHQSEMHRVHGFKGVEGILVFKGKQGLGKTQWIESLVPRRSGWVKDAVRLDPSSAGKDTVLLAISHWIVELGEIDATFRKADVSALKGFATEMLSARLTPRRRTVTSAVPRSPAP
jgi:putative DNA primase/helicase